MARLQLDLSETSDALIDKLMDLCDLRSKKDVVENALTILAWAAAASSKGLSVAAVDEERKVFTEVTSTALEGAKDYLRRAAARRVAAAV